MTQKLNQKLRKIKVLALDVDGVLTNGQIVLDQQGNEVKIFDVQDGFGIVLLKKAGLKTAIITARSAGAVKMRAKDLKIDKVYQDAYPKTEAYKDLKRIFKVRDDQVCFVGDDLADIAVLKEVGMAVAVKNATKETKVVAHYITKNCGGRGAVREIVEMILKAQGKWKKVTQI